MQVMKIRRVGNSNVVSLPHALERFGYTAGTTVLVDALPNGALCLVPTNQVRACMEECGQPGTDKHHDAACSVHHAARCQPMDFNSGRGGA